MGIFENNSLSLDTSNEKKLINCIKKYYLNKNIYGLDLDTYELAHINLDNKTKEEIFNDKLDNAIEYSFDINEDGISNLKKLFTEKYKNIDKNTLDEIIKNKKIDKNTLDEIIKNKNTLDEIIKNKNIDKKTLDEIIKIIKDKNTK